MWADIVDELKVVDLRYIMLQITSLPNIEPFDLQFDPHLFLQ